MHQVTLCRPTTNPNPSDHLHLIGVMDDLDRIRKQKVRIFQTTVGNVATDGLPYYWQYITTSKDLHLSLGEMNRSGQYHLSVWLEEEFAQKRCSQLLVITDYWSNAVLVTRTGEDQHVTFTCASAH
ncbi:MAG: hypothetical protein Q8P17_04800 [bacterium]|nr:hypothetical protein [bacterium]